VSQRTSELHQTMIELEHSKEAAESANRAKSAFLANMSHEFRTPLNAILGFTQLMVRDEQLNPEQQENLEIIHRSSEHLLGLINDVLEMSKIEAGRTTLNQRNFDLHRMLLGLEEMFAMRAEGKGIALHLELDPGVPRYVYGDEGKLRQVLMNLLGNAVKFTEHGQVMLLVQSSLAEHDQAALVSFAVEDTGPGIASEELERLFTPFVQTASGRQAQEGTGLGLPISQQYVHLMGGDIQISSTVGEGSVFKFQALLGVVKESELEQPRSSRRVVGLEPGQPVYRMLVVDDMETNRRLLIKIFAPLGFEVREAANGKEAVETAETWQPHLIFMDMRMPVMDGYEATRRIKGSTRGQAIVIVALTASGLEEDRAVILSEGCDDYLRKPFIEEDVFAAVARHLGVRYAYADDKLEASAAPLASAAEPLLSPELSQDLTRRLAASDPAWLAALEQATILGDLVGITQLANQAASWDPSLAQNLTRLANRYEHDRILFLIQRAKDADFHAASG
jgi:two-component system sensor histidine kinase/response regulator